MKMAGVKKQVRFASPSSASTASPASSLSPTISETATATTSNLFNIAAPTLIIILPTLLEQFSSPKEITELRRVSHTWRQKTNCFFLRRVALDTAKATEDFIEWVTTQTDRKENLSPTSKHQYEISRQPLRFVRYVHLGAYSLSAKNLHTVLSALPNLQGVFTGKLQFCNEMIDEVLVSKRNSLTHIDFQMRNIGFVNPVFDGKDSFLKTVKVVNLDFTGVQDQIVGELPFAGLQQLSCVETMIVDLSNTRGVNDLLRRVLPALPQSLKVLKLALSSDCLRDLLESFNLQTSQPLEINNLRSLEIVVKGAENINIDTSYWPAKLRLLLSGLINLRSACIEIDGTVLVFYPFNKRDLCSMLDVVAYLIVKGIFLGDYLENRQAFQPARLILQHINIHGSGLTHIHLAKHHVVNEVYLMLKAMMGKIPRIFFSNKSRASTSQSLKSLSFPFVFDNMDISAYASHLCDFIKSSGPTLQHLSLDCRIIFDYVLCLGVCDVLKRYCTNVTSLSLYCNFYVCKYDRLPAANWLWLFIQSLPLVCVLEIEERFVCGNPFPATLKAIEEDGVRVDIVEKVQCDFGRVRYSMFKEDQENHGGILN
ncbi:hypothetical protein HDU76_008184 [Blyttiomyces sp. JEL0837]|nr:hypothetical protein HDU76_008184 [Blyttiomyces sp. JEL0837]